MKNLLTAQTGNNSVFSVEATDYTASDDRAGASTMIPCRDYKSRVFTMLFHEPERLLELYNAISGRSYTDPGELIVTTLENAIYMSMKNDISFIIDARLSLYEHQSTHTPNMPLRFLFYLADVYSVLTSQENLYGSKAVKIPAPQFVVFYNGMTVRPEYEQLKLSDLYCTREEHIYLELLVDVYNINAGLNKQLKEMCAPLLEYSLYVDRVRTYVYEQDETGKRIYTVEAAVEKAITECIQEGILKEFLIKNRSEAMFMTIYEYNQEEHIRQERADAFEDGRAAGIMEGRTAGIMEGRAAGRMDGILEAVLSLLQKGIISLKDAANQLSMQEEDVFQLMKSRS